MTTLTDFLLARIEEDERHAEDLAATTVPLGGIVNPARMLAECEAKRRIVELHQPERVHAPTFENPHHYIDGHTPERSSWPTLLALAAVYADHPDYDETWRP